MNLKHLAIIPDGNRRWAQKNLLSAGKGHEKGAETFEKLYTRIAEMKIPYFSFWGASYDNLTKRNKTEIENLFSLLHEEFKKLLNDERVFENKIKINVIGRWREVIPEKTQKIIKECIEKTQKNDNLTLTFLLAYNGTDEIMDCISKIKEKGMEVTEENIKKNLWTKDLPPVDFLIRTGTEDDPHNSAGFMMWDTAYSQLYFTETLFPNFNEKELEVAINNFNQRKRRYGK